MQADAEALYAVLCNSYSARAEERRQAEAFLEAADRTPGFPAALMRVAVEPRAELSVRVAAAIQLKNQVRRWWAPVGDSLGKGYGEGDKAAVRAGLLDGIAVASAAPSVRAQLVEAFRLITLHDFPDGWPGLVERLVAALRSDDTVQTYCALLVLRKVFKQLEMRPTSRREDLECLCASTLPTLRALTPALLNVAAQPGPHRMEAWEMVKVVLKCLYSTLHMVVGAHLQQDIDAWMQLLLGAARLPVAATGGEEALEASPAAKCHKWVFHILFRFCHRHGNAQRCVNGAEDFAEAWSSKYAVPVTEACLREACAPQAGPQSAPKRSASLALLCVGEASSKDQTYAAMRPRLQQLLENGIFAWLRFRREDLELWREDPEEFLRQSYDDLASFHEPRAAATELLERLLRHRKTDVLMPLLQFCRHHLDLHRQNPADPELCANKDGALSLLGAMGDELVRLDPLQAGKRKKAKGRSARGVPASAISVEELLANYVQPELTGPVAFLRYRALWVYEKLVPHAPRLGPPGAAADACRACLRLAADPELPVRVRACTCLQAFLRREGDAEVRAAVAEGLAAVLERLLQTLSEVHCEEVAETLEVLVGEFPQEIVPFAAQLVGQLAASVCQMAGAADTDADDDDGGAGCAAMGSMQTIISVLQACAALRDPQDAAELQRRAQLFAGMAQPLLPMLGRLLHPDGIDFLEEALEILTYLTFYGPSPLPGHLWALFPRLYQAVCGCSAPSLPLPAALQDGWAPDFMISLLPPLENYITRGPPEVFFAGAWAEAGMTYPDMVFGIFKKAVHLTGIGSEKDCAYAAKLGATVFESVPAPAADAWLPLYFGELWLRLPKAETAVLRRAIFTALAMMLWYNAELLLCCAEERRCTQQLFQAWLQRIDLARRLADRKVLLLGFLRLFQLGCSQRLPGTVVPGMPQLVQQLAAQSREVIRLRAKRDAGADGGSGAGSEEEDEEDEEEEEETVRRALRKLEAVPDTGEDEEDEDGEDDDLDLHDEERGHSGMSLAARASPLDRLDEVSLLRRALQEAPQQMQQQVQAWIGAPLGQWLAELDAEEQRAAAYIS